MHRRSALYAVMTAPHVLFLNLEGVFCRPSARVQNQFQKKLMVKVLKKKLNDRFFHIFSAHMHRPDWHIIERCYIICIEVSYFPTLQCYMRYM